MVEEPLPDLSSHDLGDIEEAFNSDAARQLFADPVQFDLGDLLSEYKVSVKVTGHRVCVV